MSIVINGCGGNSNTKNDIYQKYRNNEISIQDSIQDIETDVLFTESIVHIVDDVLLVIDFKSKDKGIHLFDKDSFKYLTSTGKIGMGPGEIARYGRVDVDNNNRGFRMNDHGKKKMWYFSVDSILQNPNYLPEEVYNLKKDFFLARYVFLNDSIALGKAVDVINNNSFREVMVKYDLCNNESVKYGYEHEITKDKKKSLSNFNLSKDNKCYINCYFHIDLMTICDLEGNLVSNIYGPGWKEEGENKKLYYCGVDFYKNKIITGYVGDARFVFDKFKRPQGNLASKFIVFDAEGNYLQTINTGHKFDFFCVDEENNRVIVSFKDRLNQLGYFKLNI